MELEFSVGLMVYFYFYFIFNFFIVLDLSVKTNIINSTFIKNKARLNGGGIHWLMRKPDFLGNYFSENNAIYGKDISSYPTRLIFEIFEKNGEEMILLYSSKMNPIQAVLKNISPGKPIPFILRFSLVDVYGEIVKSAERFFLIFFKIYLNKNSEKIEIECENNIVITSQNIESIKLGKQFLNKINYLFKKVLLNSITS